MHETNQSPYRIAVAIAVAVLCHAVALIILSQARWQPELQRRIPFTLIVSGEEAAAPSIEQPAQADEPTVVTSMKGESPLLFRTPDTLPERPRSMRSPSTDTSWIGKLFSSSAPNRANKEPTTEQKDITQISNQDFPILSPYHAKLLQLIAQPQYQDAQYDFTTLERPRKVLLSIKLHSSGALLRVKIDKSSGDRELDAAAQRTAYAASPFPPPPSSDGSFNYVYPISFLYLPPK